MAPADRRSENAAVQGTLLSTYSHPLIRQARERQDALLRERFEGQSLAIADLGCGDGYHGSIFAPGGGVYHGYERAPALAELARERWRSEGLTQAELIEGNLEDASPSRHSYDLCWCLYFTPGNLRETFDDLSRYDDAYLDANPVFIRVIGTFLRALLPGGQMFLTVYRDVPAAEEAQCDFYLNTDQHPVTPRGRRFVATREGFWSARWTRRSMLSNLQAAGVGEEAVEFVELNEIAWLVQIVSDGELPPLARTAPR